MEAQTRNAIVAVLVFTIAAGVLGILTALLPEGQSLGRLYAWMGEAGPWAPAVFIVAFAIGSMTIIPASLLTITAGVLFGPFWGFLWAWLGVNAGAHGAYAVGRLGGERTKRLLERKLPDAMDGLDDRPFLTLLTIRPAVVIPATLVNYASGLAKIPLKAYTPASLLGFIPGTVVFVLAGGAFSALEPGSPQFWLTFGGAAVAMVGLAWGGHVLAKKADVSFG